MVVSDMPIGIAATRETGSIGGGRVICWVVAGTWNSGGGKEYCIGRQAAVDCCSYLSAAIRSNLDNEIRSLLKAGANAFPCGVTYKFSEVTLKEIV